MHVGTYMHAYLHTSYIHTYICIYIYMYTYKHTYIHTYSSCFFRLLVCGYKYSCEKYISLQRCFTIFDPLNKYLHQR